MTPPKCKDLDTDDFYEEYKGDDEPARVTPDIKDVSLQLGEDVRVGKVTQPAIGPDGTVTGTYDDNPMMNKMIYDVEFPDRQVREYTANIIAENMLTQVDLD
eukprot:5566632-Ditylum_brightwellii.AAC.1